MICAALGCEKKRGAGSSHFCIGHLRKLPAGLRASARVAAAVAYLGEADGRLARVSARASITHLDASSSREFV